MDDLLKKIEVIEKRILNLESNKTSMFGSSYSLIGNSNSDFLIKTRGKIKLLWGNKFIDLLKDGKINADSKFIYKGNEVGIKDGIYIINDGKEVWLVSGDYKLNLIGEVGNTYVSFLAPLQSTPEQKYQALLNIGFIYKNLLEVPEMQSGIIYIESEKKLYIVDNGLLSEFTISNPYTGQFIILKNTEDLGSLVIKGLGINNSIALDSMYMYSTNAQSVFDSKNDICVRINNKDAAILSLASSQFLNTVVSLAFLSLNATPYFGFRLYMDNGESVLEVDKLIVRQETSDLDVIYPLYWFGENNIILKIKSTGTSSFEITLNQTLNFELDDTLIVYLLKTDKTTLIVTFIPITLVVTGINSNIINVSSDISVDEPTSLVGKHLYKIKSKDNLFIPLSLKGNSLDLSRDNKVKTKIGDISELTGQESNYGIYTDNIKLGGDSEENLPKYLQLLGTILHSLDIKNTDLYDLVLVSVGLLKIFILDLITRIENLEQRADNVDLTLITMLQTIETMQQDIESLKSV